MGVTKSYAGLVVCRFLLGFFEAGFVPGESSILGSNTRNIADSVKAVSI